jgi:hypothetical protein
MTIEFGLTDELVNTKYAPLAALAVRYQRNQTLEPLEGVQIPMKTREFTPPAKLQQVLLSILAGCVTLSEVNTKLQPEQDLATVWQWERFADQSCLSRTLDALTLMNIDELREAVAFIWRANGQTVHHDWRGYLWLDFDLSGLPCGKQAEKSQKGYFGEKNVTGRQLARVSAIEYRETIWSDLFAGNQHTVHCFQPAVLAAETALELAPAQRKRTVWRMDGGAGTDEQLCWVLARGYHVMAKGLSNRRANALARQVCRWDAYDDIWLGEVAAPIDYGCPVRVFVKRRLKKDKLHHSYYVSSLSLPSKGHFRALYDDRGGAEVEQFRNDKSGLGLAARRKRDFLAQKGFVLLTDLAHNLLADFHHRALVGTQFETYGPKRIVRDLLAMEGHLVFEAGELKCIELLSLNQNARDLLMCLEKYCLGD